MLSVTDRACSSSAGQTRAQAGVTGELLTLPRPSSSVRHCPSLQLDGSCPSAGIIAERHESVCLAVNLAVRASRRLAVFSRGATRSAPSGGYQVGIRRVDSSGPGARSCLEGRELEKGPLSCSLLDIRYCVLYSLMTDSKYSLYCLIALIFLLHFLLYG
jgi:hypothetical protein